MVAWKYMIELCTKLLAMTLWCFYQVFLATDDDAAPLICFLLQEQKKLLSVRLQSVEINNEIVFDIKPDMSWSIPAVAAVPVIVTRPRWNYTLFFLYNSWLFAQLSIDMTSPNLFLEQKWDCCHLQISLFWLQKTPFFYM